jgi:hypothetical protein
VRPFAFDQIELAKISTPVLDPKNSHQIEDYLIGRINKMLDCIDVSKKLPELRLPILRLRIENSGFPVIKSKHLADHFLSRIANISDFM